MCAAVSVAPTAARLTATACDRRSMPVLFRNDSSPEVVNAQKHREEVRSASSLLVFKINSKCVLSHRTAGPWARAGVQPASTPCHRYKGLLHAYKAVDGSGPGDHCPGKITRRDFQRLLETLNLHTLQRKVADSMFQSMDADGNGTISYNEFARVLSSPRDVFSV